MMYQKQIPKLFLGRMLCPTCGAVAALRPSVDGLVDSLGDTHVAQPQVRRLVVVVVGAAAVQRVTQRKAHLAVRQRVLPRRKLRSRLQRLVVRVPTISWP